MAAPIPAVEPSTIIAGDTIPWTKSFPDYLASAGWALTYAFRYENGSGKVDVTASAAGSDFAVTMLAVDTAKMKSGVWVWAAYVTKAAERYQVASGSVTVLQNLATLDSQADLRSPKKRAYDNALVAWESVKLGQTVQLNGRIYTQHNLASLIVYVDRCKADYQSELDAQKVAATGINPRHIGVRFGRP
jgi:hypothetical protein